MVDLSKKIIDNAFLMSVLHIAKQEDDDQFHKIFKTFSESKNVLNSSQFKNFRQIKDLEELLNKLLTVNIINDKLKPDENDVEPITYCLQPLIAIEVQKNPCQTTENYITRFLTVRQLKNYSLPRLYYEVIRAALMSLHNVNGTNRESTWCAFTFTKIPQIIKQIHANKCWFSQRKNVLKQL